MNQQRRKSKQEKKRKIESGNQKKKMQTNGKTSYRSWMWEEDKIEHGKYGMGKKRHTICTQCTLYKYM